MATLVKWGVPVDGRGPPDGVGGQIRPEGWHEVVGRVGRVGDGVWGKGGGSSPSSVLFQMSRWGYNVSVLSSQLSSRLFCFLF